MTGATRGEGAVGAVLVVVVTGNSRTSHCKQLERGVSCGDVVVGLTVLSGPTAVGLVLDFICFLAARVNLQGMKHLSRCAGVAGLSAGVLTGFGLFWGGVLLAGASVVTQGNDLLVSQVG